MVNCKNSFFIHHMLHSCSENEWSIISIYPPFTYPCKPGKTTQNLKYLHNMKTLTSNKFVSKTRFFLNDSPISPYSNCNRIVWYEWGFGVYIILAPKVQRGVLLFVGFTLMFTYHLGALYFKRAEKSLPKLFQ